MKQTAREYILALVRRSWLPAAIIAVAIALDQWTKHLAVVHLKGISTLPLWEGVFHLTYRTNTGAAWSIFSAPDQRWIYMTISTVGILAMLACILFWRDLSSLCRIGLAMMAGGGIGNMIDRVGQGYVVDMLDFCYINYPVFNVADCFVCVGAGVLVLAFILEWRDELRAARAKGAAPDTQVADTPDAPETEDKA